MFQFDSISNSNINQPFPPLLDLFTLVKYIVSVTEKEKKVGSLPGISYHQSERPLIEGLFYHRFIFVISQKQFAFKKRAQKISHKEAGLSYQG